MTITGSQLGTVLRRIPGAYGGQVASLDVLAAGANQALRAAPSGLTVKGAAAFLATLSQESGSFRYLEEIDKTQPYSPYIGRTFEQVTWRDNYSGFGEWLSKRELVADPNVFVKAPKLLAHITWAWLGGVWFWQVRGLWDFANRGDFLATQRGVNLGDPTTSKTPRGIDARRAWYEAWLTLGPALLPDAALIDIPTTGRPTDMTAARPVWINYDGNQVLNPGVNEVWINEAHDKSWASSPNEGVDVLATIDIRDTAGRRYDGRVIFNPNYPADPVAQATTSEPQFLIVDQVVAYFQVVSYKAATPTTVSSRRDATTGDQVSFKGALTAEKDKSRSGRLRLAIEVPAGVTGLVLRSLQGTGWKV